MPAPGLRHARTPPRRGGARHRRRCSRSLLGADLSGTPPASGRRRRYARVGPAAFPYADRRGAGAARASGTAVDGLARRLPGARAAIEPAPVALDRRRASSLQIAAAASVAGFVDRHRTCCSRCTARGFGRGPLWLDRRRSASSLSLRRSGSSSPGCCSSRCRPGRSNACSSEGPAMDTFALLAAGPRRRRCSPMNLLYAFDRRDARHRGRRAAGHRPGADRGAAAAGHLQARPDRLAHHVRRHLLRRHVRRLDHLDPAQHAGRERLDRHRARGQQDGARRPRRPGAGHRRDRLVRRRHDRHARARLRRALDGRSSRSSFGPAEYFALMVLAFVTVSAALRRLGAARAHRLFIGLALGLVGIDLQTGQARLTFGVPELLDGIEVDDARGRPVRGRRDALRRRAHGAGDGEDRAGRGSVWMTPRRTGRAPGSRGCAAPRSASRSAPCRPAARRSRPSSPTRPRRRLAKHPEEFGKGAIEGVAGPEAANNASAAGTLVPLLTLGLPTSATAAIMLAGFQQYGLQPGPLLFANNAGAGLGPDRQPLRRATSCCWC